jgi:hypothetical protein
VGLVARKIEAAGIPTVTLNMIWVFQRLVGMLRAALRVFETAREPGHVEHLPFVWHEAPSDTRWHPAEPSPIIAMLQKRRPPS